MVKNQLAILVAGAVDTLRQKGIVPADSPDDYQIERTRQREHGDFASNAAMALARHARMNPRDLAAQIVEALPSSSLVKTTQIAGPGFINFFLADDAWHSLIHTIRSEGSAYGRVNTGDGKPVMVEFVSANPTGPLHVGHGRGAAYGDALARVLDAAGYNVQSEYYVNDAGRQMRTLALSVWFRYMELCGEEIDFPPNAYQGDYVFDIAADVHRHHGDRFRYDPRAVCAELPDDAELRLDTMTERVMSALGDDAWQVVFDAGADTLVNDIRNDLEQFRVHYQEWFSERSLYDGGNVEKAVNTIRENGHTYEKDGALWFRSTDFGDEKDRVVMRANGVYTYFASDIAYHLNKLERGFHHLINIWGADHHGYISRVKASLAAGGGDPDDLTVLLVQFAVLFRGGHKVSMSTRSGEFVTLRELREEVGVDAARFFYALRSPQQHMDFDLDLAKSQSNDNPVYYVQYAHARVCSVFRQLAERGIEVDTDAADLSLLSEQHESDLVNELSRFPEVVELAARQFEPHQVAYYLRTLAQTFHTYYNAHPFIASEDDIRLARMVLIDAVRQVIANGLDLLGVSAPERM